MSALRRVLPLFCVALFAAVLAGCGGGQSAETIGAETTATAAEPAPTEATDTVEAGAPVVPDVVGERLDVAEETLEDKGIAFEIILGGALGAVVETVPVKGTLDVVDPTAWEVCEQRPGAGAKTQEIELVVALRENC